MQVFNPVFIATQNPGTVYYRMACFLEKMKGEIFPERPLEHLNDWEVLLNNNSQVLYDMEKYVARADVVVWQRLSSYRGLATLMGMKDKFKKKMFTEIDDDALHVDSSNPGFAIINPESEAYQVFKKQLEISDGVIVSTERLKKIYKQHNKNIYVIENAVDLNKWGRVKDHKGIRIVWQGGEHHREDLRILMSVVPKVLKSYKVEFHFFGLMDLPDFLKIDGCFCHPPVLIDKYPKTMRELVPDIIIAPLADTNLNRARSNLRVLEAGALRVPVVATANKNLPYYDICTKTDNFLAKNTNEWVEHLLALIESKELRKVLGYRLYNFVKENYNLDQRAKQYKKLLGG